MVYVSILSAELDRYPRWSVSLGGGQALDTTPSHGAMPKQSCRDGLFSLLFPPCSEMGTLTHCCPFRHVGNVLFAKHSHDLQRGRRSDCSHDPAWSSVGTQLQKMKPEGAASAEKCLIVTPAVMEPEPVTL